jgi:hypothetical protein
MKKWLTKSGMILIIVTRHLKEEQKGVILEPEYYGKLGKATTKYRSLFQMNKHFIPKLLAMILFYIIAWNIGMFIGALVR